MAYAAIWGSFLVTAIVAIHGGWRAVPRLALGFGIGELLVWGAFSYLAPYDPGAEEVTFLAAFGCAFGALIASRFLLLRIELRCPHCGVSHRWAVLVPLWSGYAAAAILGGLAYLFAQFAVHYVADPANAAVAVVLVSLLCTLLGGGYGARLARWAV
jgi:hypothetical protein